MPLLIASNPEMGGFGSSNDGTFVSTHLQAGSHPDKSIARDMGDVAGAECHAIGCNWAFAPIVDIHYNWRNTVISTRAFGNTPEVVIERAKEYFDGITAHNMVCAIKHFPGDGIDERDQHVVTSYNTLPADEWDQTYGRVYRELIDHGVQSIMVGHIGAPELSRKYRPGITDAEILPATLSPELLQDLLRGELGFNGLILTDASQMIGLTQAMRRRDLVPATIAAGCDMFLFFRNPEEDFQYMLDGYRNGIITEQRLQDALERILALKASLGLHRTARADIVPGPEALAVVGSEQHHAIAAAIADKTVTLLKDTQHNLPITPDTHPRIRLYGVSGGSDFTRTDPLGYLDTVRDELEAQGFKVHVFKTAAQRQADGRNRCRLHVRDLRRGPRRLRREVRRRLHLRQRQGLRPGGGHQNQVVNPDGRRNPLVRNRSPHRIRVPDAADAPDRRADGEDRHQRARRHPGGHPRHHSEDHGPVRVPGHLQRQRLLRLLRHPAVVHSPRTIRHDDSRHKSPSTLQHDDKPSRPDPPGVGHPFHPGVKDCGAGQQA